MFVWFFPINIVFDNPQNASLFAVVFWIISLISGYFTVNLDETSKNWFCLLSPCCLNISINNLSKYESSLMGLHWNNINDIYFNFKFKTSIIMFYIDFILYIILALYFDKIWPSKYGTKKLSFYFCCLPSFWCTKRQNLEKSRMMDFNVDEMDIQPESELFISESENKNDKIENITPFEPINNKYISTQPSISIKNLTKCYENFTAVDNISLDLYSGQIFCLLGHNGM